MPACCSSSIALSREGQTVFQKAGYMPSASRRYRRSIRNFAGDRAASRPTCSRRDTVEKNRKHWDDIFDQLFR